jgi:hypothetical protein
MRPHRHVRKAGRVLVRVCTTVVVLSLLNFVVELAFFADRGTDCDAPCGSNFQFIAALTLGALIMLSYAVVAVYLVWRVLRWGVRRATG